MEGESVAMAVAFGSARKREEIMAGTVNLEEESTSQQQQEGCTESRMVLSRWFRLISDS